MYTMPMMTIVGSRGGGYQYGGGEQVMARAESHSSTFFAPPGQTTNPLFKARDAWSSDYIQEHGFAYDPVVAITTAVQATVQATLTLMEEVMYGPTQDGMVLGAAPFGLLGGGKIAMPYPTGNGIKVMDATERVIWIERPNGTIDTFSSSNHLLEPGKLADASYGVPAQRAQFEASVVSGQRYGLYEGYRVVEGTAVEWLEKSGLGK